MFFDTFTPRKIDLSGSFFLFYFMDNIVPRAIRNSGLRQQVKRNPKRFPSDFMFQLSKNETDILLSQNVIPGRRSLGGSLPYVFTEQGVAMLSSVLTSGRAIEVNIA